MERNKSPYWEWVHENGGREPYSGNLDQLSDEHIQEAKSLEKKNNSKAKAMTEGIEKLCTEKELEIVNLLKEGVTQKEISKLMNKPISTINNTVANIRKKALRIVRRCEFREEE